MESAADSPIGRTGSGVDPYSREGENQSPLSMVHRNSPEDLDDPSFTSESVTEGHPDKIADQISEQIDLPGYAYPFVLRSFEDVPGALNLLSCCVRERVIRLSFVDETTTGSWEPRRVIELVHLFMDEWMGAVEPEDGISEAELDAAEDALGFAIPPLLRRFHGLLGRRRGVLRVQDPVLRPGELYLHGPDILVIREENQRCALWGISYGAGPDFDVMWMDRNRSGAEDWQDYGQPLSSFLLEAIMSEGMFTESVHTVYCFLDEVGLRAIRDSFRALVIPPHVYWPQPDGPPLRWYGDQDVLIREDGTRAAWAMGRTAEVLELVSDRVPGDWEWPDL